MNLRLQPFRDQTVHRLKAYSTQTHLPPVWGYQKPETFELPDFTPQQLFNRASQPALVRLVDSYRRHAHRSATLDPLSLTPRPPVPALDPRRYGFKLSSKFLDQSIPPTHQSKNLPEQSLKELGDENKLWSTDGVIGMGGRNSTGQRALAEIIDRLESVYCRRIGYEYMHLPNKSEREWIANELESNVHDHQFSSTDKLRYLKLLTRSERFDRFLAQKFPNLKRYGLEGGESLLVALERIFEECGTHNVNDVVIAMPHRGRLNVLTQLLSFDLRLLVRKLKGKAEISDQALKETPAYTGDVLSHLSSSSIIKTNEKKDVKVHVLPNPSHLEAVSPVGLGFARAFSMIEGTGPYAQSGKDHDQRIGDHALSLQIHGDAAFGGQGVVAETLNLSTLPHFTVGGSIRLVLNNQLGYTTPATEGRTSFYATDLGKSIGAPIIHVNGEYPEEVSRAVSLAFAFRNKFRKDVLVDLVVYRRWGHNEFDEPTYTSPHMYRKIDSLASVPTRYEEELLASKVIDEKDAEKLKLSTDQECDSALETWETYQVSSTGDSKGLMNLKSFPGNNSKETKGHETGTGVEVERLRNVGKASVTVPKEFNVHPRLQKMHISKRLEALSEGKENQPVIDFSTAEALAFGTLLQDGYHIRLSGQDSGRGTFSQRHGLLTDQTIEGKTVVPLNHSLGGKGIGRLELVNSPLSEYAVLGYEVGISYLTHRRCLTLWEAQFGDFINPAQVTVDSFVTSGSLKWPGFESRIVLLLPHGSDGGGPDHSTCRPERFLQASNEPRRFEDRKAQVGRNGENLSVVNPSTPAQYFHLLRRQMLDEHRRALIVCAPKTLLRARDGFSRLSEMGVGTKWQEVLDDPRFVDGKAKEHVEKVILCSGKVFYDLMKKLVSDDRVKGKISLVRVEELTPFPYKALYSNLKTYSNLVSVNWVQEEPENSGPLEFVFKKIEEVVDGIEESSKDEINLFESRGPRTSNGLKRIKRGYVSRPASASPATGIGEVFKREKEELESRALEI
ncbi:hypothetical protein CROQUDRAFT_650848 [Cronartium quercuum f. sp. fusiforme G11]|uniref:Transketolase-like pyrimidine-binding domain-containing protein n=1 Tax=Cronartium quercuum f. sp. fusiforme G11 TaxID=708437 RepID=A0A9P6TIH2_9BASI|nr:hypothetical protein CROQUDRAFT_650848 [Cronartium quercuum f. sp. fusiforme G11]